MPHHRFVMIGGPTRTARRRNTSRTLARGGERCPTSSTRASCRSPRPTALQRRARVPEHVELRGLPEHVPAGLGARRARRVGFVDTGSRHDGRAGLRHRARTSTRRARTLERLMSDDIAWQQASQRVRSALPRARTRSRRSSTCTSARSIALAGEADERRPPPASSAARCPSGPRTRSTTRCSSCCRWCSRAPSTRTRFGEYRLLWLAVSTLMLITPMCMAPSLYYFLPRSDRPTQRLYINQTLVFLRRRGHRLGVGAVAVEPVPARQVRGDAGDAGRLAFRPRRMISLSTLNADVARSMLMRLEIRSSAPAATSFNWKVDPLAPMTVLVAAPSETNAN